MTMTRLNAQDQVKLDLRLGIGESTKALMYSLRATMRTHARVFTSMAIHYGIVHLAGARKDTMVHCAQLVCQDIIDLPLTSVSNVDPRPSWD